jgi:hypothetical protein
LFEKLKTTTTLSQNESVQDIVLLAKKIDQLGALRKMIMLNNTSNPTIPSSVS